MQPDSTQNGQQPAQPQQPQAQPYSPPTPGVQMPQQPVATVVSLAPDTTTVPAYAPAEQPVQAAAPVMVQQPPVADEVVTRDPESQAEATTESPSQIEQEPVRWQANEYIHHEKSPAWFILFAVVVLVLIAIAIFLIQSITFAVLVPVMAAALLVYTHRPPRVLGYTLSRQGIHVNDHLYAFGEFKAFGVIHDGEEYSVMLLPTKRFKPAVSVYFPEESGEAIVDMLGARLPMQELHLDIVDKIVRKLRI